MQYIIIPTEVFEQADMALAKKLGLDQPRKSVDGTEVIMHIESYNRLFSGAKSRKARIAYPIYESDTTEFTELLSSQAWTAPEEDFSDI